MFHSFRILIAILSVVVISAQTVSSFDEEVKDGINELNEKLEEDVAVEPEARSGSPPEDNQVIIFSND